MISNQIEGNSYEPGVDAGISAKRLAIPVRLPEAVLSQRFGQIHVLHGGKHEPKDPRPILFYKPFKVLDFECRVVHAHGNESGCRGRLHALL